MFASKYYLLMMSLFISLGQIKAEDLSEFYPTNILLMDKLYAHHVAIVEKSTHRLFLYSNKNNSPKLLRTFKIASGKITGDKKIQGDHKTPEGIYSLTNFIPSAELVSRYGKEGEIYGIGAFVMNYPNYIDQKEGKTGGGIWLHSTNDDSRIDKGLDSRGCVVVNDLNLVEISKYIELEKTTMIIEQDVNFISKVTWQKSKDEILDTVNQWVTAWGNEDIESYLSYYHPKLYSDNFRSSYNEFASYKRRVFKNPGEPKIGVENLSILKSSNDYAVVRFTQNYSSNTINDVGTKVLYLKQDDSYNWKIVNESWYKLAPEQRVAFTPSQRFFSEESLQKRQEGDSNLSVNLTTNKTVNDI